LALLSQLSGQQTQRDISGGQLGLGYADLAERNRQANQDYQLRRMLANLQLSQAQHAGTFNTISGIAGIIGSLAGLPLGGGATLGGKIFGAIPGLGRSTAPVGSSSLPVVGP